MKQNLFNIVTSPFDQSPGTNIELRLLSTPFESWNSGVSNQGECMQAFNIFQWKIALKGLWLLLVKIISQFKLYWWIDKFIRTLNSKELVLRYIYLFYLFSSIFAYGSQITPTVKNIPVKNLQVKEFSVENYSNMKFMDPIVLRSIRFFECMNLLGIDMKNHSFFLFFILR